MSRPIKFRVWDKDAKRMIKYGEAITKYLKIGLNGVLYWGDRDMSNDLEIMQFTGLRDDNGKEVYEGDVISIPEMGRYEVVFKEGCFGAEDGQGFAPFRQTIWGLGGEVIGNIHDNPSLLGVKS